MGWRERAVMYILVAWPAKSSFIKRDGRQAAVMRKGVQNLRGLAECSLE